MELSALIDTVIVMAFLFILVSLAASGLSESIALGLDLRGNVLMAALNRALFAESKNKEPGASSIKKLYENPLMEGLHQLSLGAGAYASLGSGYLMQKLGKFRKRLPSWIPANVFQESLMQYVLPKTSQENPLQDLQTLEAALEGLKDEKLKALLKSILASSAVTSVETFRKEVEGWYDRYMNQVKSWYARKMSLITLIAGFIVAVVANVDLLEVGGYLLRDKEARTALADYVSATYAPLKKDISEAKSRAAVVSIPSKPDSGTTAAKAAADSASLAAFKQSVQRFDTRLDSVQALAEYGMPIGWDLKGNQDTSKVSKAIQAKLPRATFLWITMPAGSTDPWYWRILGWVLTAWMASLGAPFWYDVLNKLVPLRKTGNERVSTEEKPAPNAK